jgi:hypothetical protein
LAGEFYAAKVNPSDYKKSNSTKYPSCLPSTLEDAMVPGWGIFLQRSAFMLFDPTRPVLSLLVLAFCITILWAAITATMTLQRIATSIELLVRQKEKLGAN